MRDSLERRRDGPLMGNRRMRAGSRFVQHCLAGLERMYVPAEHALVASYRFVQGAINRIKDPSQEFRYVINSLRGLHGVRRSDGRTLQDSESEYHQLLMLSDLQAGYGEDVAAPSWSGRCIQAAIPSEVGSLFNHRFGDAQRLVDRTTPSWRGGSWRVSGTMTRTETKRPRWHS
jgi:hypothetical protein